MLLHPAVAEVHEDEEEGPTEKPAEDEEVQEELPDTTMTPGASSSSRGDKRTEPQEATSVKKRLTTKSSTEKRDVHMPVEIEDPYLLNIVNTLLDGETGEEAEPWRDSEQAKILAVLDDPKEVKKGRQKELKSLSGMGVLTAVNAIISSWQTSDTDAMG